MLHQVKGEIPLNVPCAPKAVIRPGVSYSWIIQGPANRPASVSTFFPLEQISQCTAVAGPPLCGTRSQDLPVCLFLSSL